MHFRKNGVPGSSSCRREAGERWIFTNCSPKSSTTLDRGLPPRLRIVPVGLRLTLPKTEELLRNFQKSHAGVSLSQLQEAYTSIFDMQPECTLNLGYQLLGDDWRRSIFLFKLKEI